MTAQTIKINEDDADQRLDRWLRKSFPDLKQGNIEKLLRKGAIRVDGQKVKSSFRLEAGQSVSLPVIEEKNDEDVDQTPKTAVKKITKQERDLIENAILYQDAEILVLNKPAGLAVQGGSKQKRHLESLLVAFGKIKLVHRLDKDTSGVLVLAKTDMSARKLTEQFRTRDVQKIYWAAIAGSPRLKAGTIRYALAKAGGKSEKVICFNDVKDHPDAKHARTDFVIIENAGRRCAWVVMKPVTGRTHQLRAHMAEFGHPIIGDGKYSSNAQTNDGDGWGAQLGGEISRKLHLHARYIEFTHPKTNRRVNFTAILPDHMKRTWDMLGWAEQDASHDILESLD